MRVYLDNSATSFPKPKQTVDAMMHYMRDNGSSVARSTSSQAMQSNHLMYDLRSALAQLFHFDAVDHVILTKNITESLNIVLHGLLKKDDTLMVSSIEHNAVIRPLHQIGCHILPIPVSNKGDMDLSFVKENIDKVNAVICCHISNVSGDIMPVDDLADLCQKSNKPLIVDAAQSAGFLDIDMNSIPISCLCFTGHKSLLGPSGTGGFLIQPSLADKVQSLVQGGTGSRSNEDFQPDQMPDKFEAGTPNIVGYYGLAASVSYLQQRGLHEIREVETNLGTWFFEKLSQIEGVHIIGNHDYEHKPPVFSMTFDKHDSSDLSYQLSSQYQIDTRCGLHCSPWAHKTYQTFPQGTLRMSLSSFTTKEALEYTLTSLSQLLSES